MTEKTEAVFFGSGPVAMESLLLLADSFKLEAIITKPSTGDDMRHAFPDVLVLSAGRRAELEELCLAQKFHSKLGIVIDFGVIIDQATIDSFPLGIINSHFSLLPEWRGVDPITFAILSGQKETGVSLMRITRAWDEGPLLAQAPYTIPAYMTGPQLTHSLIEISDAMLKAIVPLYVRGEIEPQDQLAATIGPREVSYSRKLTKEDGHLDWAKPAAALEREIRAFISWPRSYTMLAKREVIITEARATNLQGKPGMPLAQNKHLYVHCGEGALEILSLKPAGKKEMSASAFLAGYGKQL